MEKWMKEVVITIAIAAVVVMAGCSHTKKDTAAPETAAPQVVAPEPEETDVMAEGKILNTIYFDFDKSDLQSNAIDVLKKIGGWLTKNPDKKIRIEGHCDERGTDEYNIALGERRAQAAKNYLSTMGIPMQNVSTLSFGEEKPADPGHNEAAWSKNRRAEFKIVK
jgi:peptidoglycan-associated lipoprotein